jgi:amino acid adenylation domain-containing protein
VIGLLGILKAGGAYVPLDPNYPKERLNYMLEDASLNVVLSQNQVQAVLTDFKGSILMLDELGGTDSYFCEAYANSNLIAVKTGLTSSNLAYMIYTSGSTGRPKGVLTEHISVARLVFNPDFMCLNKTTVMLQSANIAFDAATLEIWGPLLNGGQSILYPHQYLSPEALNSVIERYQVNALWLTAGLFREWSYGVPNVSPLKYLLAGGDVLDPDAIKRVQRILPKITLINGYGPTENTTFSTTYTFEQPHSFNIVPIGKKLSTDEAYIFDATSQMVPYGTVGELFVGGDGLARGYLNRPELTAERFIENPFYDESKATSSPRLYKTGDLVRYLPDGNLEFIGRADDQVKIRGFRIELGEIEAQLTKQVSVDSALVMAKELAGSQQLVGYIKPQGAMAESDRADYVAAVKAQLAKRLPEYMIPSVIMVVEQWPLTPNGKVDRKALPTPDGSVLQGEYVAPTTETEQILVDIWASLLNIEAGSISTSANFFELGGHSLLSIRLVSDIRNRCEMEVSLQSIFDNSTLHGLAKVIEQGTQTVVRPPLLVVNRESDKLPVSFAQQRLWFIDSLQGGSPEYNMPMAFEVEGQLNTVLVKDVFNTILERHEVLRTVYLTEGDKTLQHIRSYSDVAFEIDVHDFSHLTGETLKAQIKTLVEADITRPFDLAKDLMLRVNYVQKTAESGVMILNMHHIASDGWSMEVLTKEFFELYKAYSQGQVNPLAALAFQYADYAHWQRDYLTGKVLESQLGYWEQQLDELPAVHSLPLDFARPEVKQHQGAIVSGQLPATVAKQLLAVAKQYQLTPFMLLHGALSLLFSRHSNSNDIVIATPVANRLQAELEPLIGFFVNTLVLRADTKHESLSDYLAHIRQVNLDAQSNQDVPFEQLVERLKVPRSTAHSPLFQIMMTTSTDYGLNDASDIASFTLPGVDIQAYQSDFIQAKFDLDVGLNISEQGVNLHWTYDVSLFTETHISQLNEHLCRLLTGIAQTQELSTEARATQALHALPMLSNDEIQHLVYELNDTAMDYSRDQCIHELFEQQAAANPDNIAVVFEDKQLTYQQLNQKANQLAHYLRDNHAVKPDTLVGLCVERSLEMVIGLLGILKAGGAYVPLDPNYPKERLNYMLEDAALELVLSQTQVQDVFPRFDGIILMLDEMHDTNNHFCREYDKRNLSAAEIGLTSSNLAYVIYTSGSTGQPKGVMTEHRSLLNFGEGFMTQTKRCRNDVDNGWLWLSSFTFDASLKGIYLLASGTKLIIPTSTDAKSPEAIVKLINQHNIGIINATPQLLESIVKTPNLPNVDLMSSGEGIGAGNLSVFKQFAQKAETTLVNAYGPTESTVNSSFSDLTLSNKESIGRPVGNTLFYVLSRELTLAPLGTVGELYVGGDGLARGYLNRPKLTAERFVENPFYDESEPNSSARLYRTGDLVRYLADDSLEFIGRTDDQVKIRGFRIELGEIEAPLTQLESVDSAIVMAKELAGSQQLVGYVKPAATTQTEWVDYIATLKAKLAEQLPEYMIPSVIMVVEQWPLTLNGKVDRKALPAPDGSSLQGEYVAPTTETEKRLVDIWAGLLNIEAESISTSANFFDLGGHSLLILRLLNSIERELDLTLDIQGLYEIKDIRELAQLCDSIITKIKLKVRLMQKGDTELEEVEF